MLHLKNCLNFNQQLRLVEMCRDIAKVAPFVTPVMPSGQPFNCQQTSCGQVGWISDKNGYRYSRKQQASNKAFPEMPEALADLAIHFANLVNEPTYLPDTCLINYYPASNKGKLGLHQDNSEANLKPAIISISIGDDCEFLIGGTKRSDALESIVLRSGDVLIMHGESRLAYHGVRKVIGGTAPAGLLKNGGRLNLTIRQVF